MIENAYIKYQSNEIQNNNKKLHNEIINLKLKLDQCYKSHANSIILLQEKNQHLQEMIQEKNQHIQNIIGRPNNISNTIFRYTYPIIHQDDFEDYKSELTNSV
jgi:hypothetical protein